MSKKKTPDDYEVGYGKPPKKTQFQRGVSGNPRRRPKKSLDFYQELLRESKSFIAINENGRRKRITKQQVIIKQMMKYAMTKSTASRRIYFGLSNKHSKGSLWSQAPKRATPGSTRLKT